MEICLNTRLRDYDGEKMTLADGRTIPAHTLIWTAGVRAAELTDHLGLAQGSGARLIAQDTLQLAGHPEVFLIGDAAYLVDEHGKPLPMLATVAQQEARAVPIRICEACGRVICGLSCRELSIPPARTGLGCSSPLV